MRDAGLAITKAPDGEPSHPASGMKNLATLVVADRRRFHRLLVNSII